jgi:CMP-N-acetylneuraminate monooxygenase
MDAPVRIELVCQACSIVTANGLRMLTDPWIEGPAYHGGWWHCPPPVKRIAELGFLDWIYLSHAHPDHFHPPTLMNLIPRNTPLLEPRR